MKRASTQISRAPAPPPAPIDASRRASAAAKATAPLAPVEQLRFRERDGKPSAYTRLYAQGVDQLVHKDHVYQQYGLHKSPPAQTVRNKAVVTPVPTHQSTKPTVAPAATGTSQRHRSSSTTHRSTTARSSTTSAAAVTPRHRSHSNGHFHAQHHHPQGPSKTSNATKRAVTTTKSKVPTPAPAPKPQRRQSAIATQLLHKTLKIGPALLHLVSTAAMLPPSQASSARSPRLSMTPNALVRRPSVATTAPPPSPQAKSLNRRQSFQVAATPRPVTGSSVSKSVGKLSTKDSPVRANASDNAVVVAPTLVPVSRRTSSPLVAPIGADFGMRRRPSVSPIRSTATPPSLTSSTTTDGPSGGAAPRSSIYVPQRRDSKMDRLVEQITVLKNSLGLSDEDLQWKVESTKGNAYEAADRHLTEAEEQYDRLVYEIQLLSETPCDEASVALVKRLRELLKQNHVVTELKPALAGYQADVVQRKKELLDARIACELAVATRGGGVDDASDQSPLVAAQQRLDDAKQRILQTQTQLTDEMTKLNDLLVALGKETDTLAAACARFKFLSPDAADVSASFLNILRCVPECGGDKLVALCEQGVQTAQRFTGSKAKELKRKEAEAEKTLRDIEVWKTRKEQSKEFAAETAKRERAWKLAQHESNVASLQLLRRLVPIDIQQLTVDGLIERARETGGVLYTYDLALYIKHNRLLHWLVTHESDIARDNFLAVECASFFLNFTSYDIHELRAVCEILPETFDFDKEGKKTEWKRQFVDHVRMLVKQQGGETIKAGWDAARGARADVPLKPLSDKQQLNAVYRYPMDDEIQARIDKFELQLQRLQQKKDKRDKLETHDIPTAKSEYLAIAEDARSEELQHTFGKATLIKMRDDAKQAFQALCKTRDGLKSEIDHAERQWGAQTPSYDQFLSEVAKIKALDPATRSARIPGPFPGDLELKPRARAAFKKLSVEEEAEARRVELSKAIADRDKGLVEETSAVVPTVAVSDAVVPTVAVSDAVVPTVAVSDAVAMPVVETVTAPVSPRESQSEASETPSPSEASPVVVSTAPTAPSEEPAPFRKVKSLRVSTEVLRFLQNDFCSPRRTKSSTTLPISEILGTDGAKPPPVSDPPTHPLLQRRRPSLPKAVDEKIETKKTTARANVKSSEPTKPKSKALLALLEKQAAVAEAPPAVTAKPVGMKLDFLSELKRKAGKSDSKPDEGPSTDTAPSPQRPGIAKTIGQLDLFSELKNRTKPQTEETSAATNTHDEPAPKKLNFLQELVGRAKSKTSVSPTEGAASASSDKATVSPSEDNTSAVSAATSTPLLPPPPASTTAPRSFLDELKAKALKRSSD